MNLLKLQGPQWARLREQLKEHDAMTTAIEDAVKTRPGAVYIKLSFEKFESDMLDRGVDPEHVAIIWQKFKQRIIDEAERGIIRTNSWIVDQYIYAYECGQIEDWLCAEDVREL